MKFEKNEFRHMVFCDEIRNFAQIFKKMIQLALKSTKIQTDVYFILIPFVFRLTFLIE